MKKRHHKLKSFTYLAFSIFASTLLFFLEGTVQAGGKFVEIAQQQETSQQATRAEAERVFDEGMKLYRQGTAQSLRQAIEKWLEALKLYRQIGDKAGQATTLNNIGRVYDDLGDKQLALKFYQQALPLRIELGDKAGQATTLNNIGAVYDSLGDKQLALKFYQQALPLSIEVGDKAGQATTLNNIGGVYDDLGDKQLALKFYQVTPDSFQAYELPTEKQIEDAANKFGEVLSGSTPYGKDHPDAINRSAYQFSQMILAPVANKLEKKRLVIVADGALQSIPFAALADVTSKSPSPYQPLTLNHEIVNLPSVTAIATHRQNRNKRQQAPKTLAVLADPVFEANDKRVTGKEPALGKELDVDHLSLQRAMKNLKRDGIPRLEGTRAEAEAILKLVSPSLQKHAYDFDANYNFVSSPELKQYRFLLFATHGFVDTVSPELSGLVLAQVDKQGHPVKKGYLRLGDIFNLDLNAELVVLSACQTGLGKDVKGEGLMGLTRGLMYAGSKRAVVSLWQVNDEGTSKLMPLFYKAILQGKSPTVALRDAQKQLWRDKAWRNPYYWAAFTLQGDWR